MKNAALALSAFVAFQHVLFLVVEMFLWKTPRIRKNFGMSEQLANDSAPLAMNQGLYNGFLAAGLAWGVYEQDLRLLTFFLACVVVAGIFGGLTAKKTIILIQGLPAGIALALVRIGLPLLLVGALVGLADAEEPAKAGTLQSTTYGFSLDVPAFPKLEEEQYSQVVHFPAPPGSTPSSVSVSVEIRSRYTFERLRELVRNNHVKQGLTVREEKELEVSGRKAVLFASDGPLKGTQTKVLELVVLDAPRFHRVHAQAKADDWKRDEGVLRASLESFRLAAKK